MSEYPGNQDRFVLAFYGGEPETTAVERFFRETVSWFTELGLPPDKLSVHGDGHSGRISTFRRGLSRLEMTGFEVVESFSIFTLVPNAGFPAADYYGAAAFSRAARPGRYAVLAIPSLHGSRDVWSPVARRIISCLRPAYGIGFERHLSRGPVFYALGANVSRPDDEVAVGEEYDQRRSISRWCDTGMLDEVYRRGLLRYVYRWNFLTQPQLEREVEGVSLAEWIEADSQRGVLSGFCDDVWLWEVLEEQLERLRSQLHEAGAIFDWRKYCNVEPHIKTRLG